MTLKVFENLFLEMFVNNEVWN